MDIQNTQSQMRKGVLEFCILSIIRQGEVYPSDLVEKMKAANLHILEGTLYPLVRRLAEQELLNTNAQLQKLASTDRLTGLWNRRELDARLDQRGDPFGIHNRHFRLGGHCSGGHQ